MSCANNDGCKLESPSEFLPSGVLTQQLSVGGEYLPKQASMMRSGPPDTFSLNLRSQSVTASRSECRLCWGQLVLCSATSKRRRLAIGRMSPHNNSLMLQFSLTEELFTRGKAVDFPFYLCPWSVASLKFFRAPNTDPHLGAVSTFGISTLSLSQVEQDERSLIR